MTASRPSSTSSGGYGHASSGRGAPGGRPSSSGAPSYGRHAGDAHGRSDDGDHSDGDDGKLGMAGALPAENRRAVMERQRALERQKAAARARGGMAGGMMRSTLADSGGLSSPGKDPQRTPAVRQFSQPRAADPGPGGFTVGGRPGAGVSRGRDAPRGGRMHAPMRSALDDDGPEELSDDDSRLKPVAMPEARARRDAPSGAGGAGHGTTGGESDLARAIRSRDRRRTESKGAEDGGKLARELAMRGVASTFDPTGDSPDETGDLDFSDMRRFLTTPTPQRHGTIECYIRRNKSGLNKLYPVYQLFLKEGDRFLLAAKKRPKQKTSNYLISMDARDLSRGSPSFVGKLRSNFVGTEFTVYDDGVNPKDADEKDAPGGKKARLELAICNYASNVLGSRGPRKMKVCVPKVRGGERVRFQPTDKTEEMMGRFKAKDFSDMVYMINKPPRWNEQVGAYVLNFNGRVTMASVKNFQLVNPDDQETVLLQFGRVGKDSFTMDYRWPLCPVQAFGIALSSFDYKLACE